MKYWRHYGIVHTLLLKIFNLSDTYSSLHISAQTIALQSCVNTFKNNVAEFEHQFMSINQQFAKFNFVFKNTLIPPPLLVNNQIHVIPILTYFPELKLKACQTIAQFHDAFKLLSASDVDKCFDATIRDECQS